MKKNKNGLIHSLILFAFFSALIVTTITEQVKTLDGFEWFVIVLMWFFQTLGVLGIATYLKKPKSNHDWTALEERKIFTIVSFVDKSFDGEFMEMKPDHSGYMVVKIEKFGKTLMSFPNNLLAWGNKVPEAGKNYMIINNNFVQIPIEIKE